MKHALVLLVLALMLSEPGISQHNSQSNRGPAPGLQACYFTKAKKEQVRYTQTSGLLNRVIGNPFRFITDGALGKLLPCLK